MSIKIIKNGNTWEVFLVGNIDFSEKNSFRDLINCFSSDNVKNLILDFSEVTKVESSSLGSLLLLKDESKKFGADIILRKVDGNVKTIFQKSALGEIFAIFR
jgi:anti-anti-sigma factor